MPDGQCLRLYRSLARAHEPPRGGSVRIEEGFALGAVQEGLATSGQYVYPLLLWPQSREWATTATVHALLLEDRPYKLAIR
jgi:hypothetical protein